MRIFIVTFGSVGDVIPYVALGVGLQRRGHSVTLCTNACFASLVNGHGLRYAHMNDGFPALVQSAAGRAAIASLSGVAGFLKTGLGTARQLGPIMRETLEDAWTAASAARPDVILFYPKATWAVHFAEKLRVPVAMLPLFPQFVPTAHFPAAGIARHSRGAAYNRFTYHLVRHISNRIGRGHIRAWRRRNGLSRRSRTIDLLTDAEGRPIPLLHGFSRHIVPEPPDWPEWATNSGDWLLPRDPDWQAPDRLVAFLEAGSPPVYVGFGSMAGRDPRRTTRTVVRALELAGVRGILASGWGGLASEEMPDTILDIDAAPHDWLFPRMSAVVHHGGAGTTAAGLLAGRATVVCPFFGDQSFWGERVHLLGVGPEPIPQKELTAERLAAAIRIAVDDPEMSQRADRLAQCIADEDGIRNAATVIEGLAG